MKKQLLFICLFFIISIAMTAQTSNNKYEKEWKEVEQFDTDNLPQSALQSIDGILKKAIADKNSTQIVKALINKNKYKRDIDYNDNEGILYDLQDITEQTSDISQKALLYSMLAEAYADYYSRNSWRINRRTNLSDTIPQDIKEWTESVFVNKIVNYLQQSVADVATLKKHTTAEYDDIINMGVDKLRYPTLYDFLMKRAIDIAENIENQRNRNFDAEHIGLSTQQLTLPAKEYVKLDIKQDPAHRMLAFSYYQEYFKDLLARNMTATVILTEINKVGFLQNRSQSFTGDEVLKTYQNLEKEYETDENSTEIIAKIVDSYNSYNYRHDGNNLVSAGDNEAKYNWLKKGLDKYPNSYGARILEKKLQALESPKLLISGKKLQHPDGETALEIRYKNTPKDSIYPFKLLRQVKDKFILIKEYPLALASKTTYNADILPLNIGKLQPGNYTFTTKAIDDINKEKEKNEDDKYSYNYKDNRFDFIVSALMAFSRNSAKNEYEIFVVEKISGKPVKDVTVKIYSTEKDEKTNESPLLATVKTNELGIATFKDARDIKYNYNIATYKVELGEDSYLPAESLNNDSYRWNTSVDNNIERTTISLFADRSIYRPGQTVYFKAVLIDKESKALPNQACTIKLYNANNEEVAKKEIITNEFGSVSGEFILPQSGLLGQYRVEINNDRSSSYYFNVEEYKRPTFEVTFEKLKETYAFGEEIKLKGYAKNYSGVSLQGAEVKYTITRERFSFWRWGGGYKAPFVNDTLKTNDDGSFEIVFTPQLGDDKSYTPFNQQNYTFEITATVTDLNGETQSNKHSINVGNISMAIRIDIPELLEKSGNDKIKITAKNLQGEDIETSGTYMLYSLDENNSAKNKVSEGSFKSGEQASLKSSLKNLSSGKYQLQIKALDSKNNEIAEKKDFTLYSYNDKKPPVKTNQWLIKKNTSFGNGKPAEVIFGVSDKDIYVLYQLNDNKKVFERRFIKMSEANQLFSVPYKAEYGDNIYMTFTFVKDGKMYNQSVSLNKGEETPDTKLNLKLEVFRDKLRPGQAETWTISVKDTTNTPAAAELLASMYDVSLDQLYAYMPWTFRRPYTAKESVYPISYNYPSRYQWDDNQQIWFNSYPWSYKSSHIYNTPPPPMLPDSSLPPLNDRRFDQLNWFGYIYQGYEQYVYSEEELDEYYKDSPQIRISISTVEGSADAVGIDIVELREHKVVVEESVVAPSVMRDTNNRMLSKNAAMPYYLGESANTGGGAEDTDDQASAPQIRQNFSETAFFYPQLRTNEKGETLISFTVPESNTTWRFRALAHDQNSKVGTLEQFVVTQKELMVTPNMPRFVRQGDKTNISTKISNLSESAISGDVRIEFFDPATDKVINLNIANQKQTFSVDKDASVSADWTFDIPENIELIGCRIVAQNQTFSDGEQHVLAVLPNRMLVTESMPVDATTAGTNTFTFDKLYNNSSATIGNYKLTLEYASNPAWYAVQALPSFSNPTNENAVNWFASYYVNTLGSSITRQYPKVAQMIEAWKKQGGDKQTFASKLQKDEELKNVLLEETPWVLDAKNEAEQIQRLSLLFDLNNTNQLTNAATRKLQELQNKSDGGWSWYKGMYSSRAVSQYVLYGYAKLQQVGQVQYPQDIKMMQMDALKYIDSQILKDFESLKKNNKNWEKTTYISTNQLEYAYVRSFYRDIPISQETRAAERFFTNVASKNWKKLDLYEQSILSAILKRNGENELANKIIKSIREHAVKDPKTGMYWPNIRSRVFMSMSAISVHTFLMEALQENGSSQEEMDMLKRWLINQKRTQVWESTHASIDAISTLLSTGSDWFASEETPSITVGGQKVEAESKEAGTGYFKKVWDKSEITNDMGKVEITASNTRPSYGAMYWQYYENLDKVTAQKGDLNVEKQLYKENDTPTGKSLTRITEDNPLTVGDKVIVRLTIRTNKDMEFVQLKDMRAPCFEPLQTISGVKWNESLMYYQTPKDASTNFYFDFMPKGTYVFEYPVYVNRTGEYANGITTIQCMYAPEFVSHTSGIKVTVR
ncbi:hypothetical protein D0T84_12960 [Dysgonomonas sp. 521]|uniref:alpha-2-macroglobulin family protein n=1 Tax=Dysgonomonas sp. 521 TaxID=2302932 RepID=UPI0013CF65D8|nr:alpha-2-macroglobulin family protein [Dysgonomonas sp. 521]NDV95813.1 hypothetical protein [Dysgonomonas sp. 521]